jgi:hypothetical protein
MKRPTDDAIEDKAADAAVRSMEPTHFRNMTYEEGVSAALDWVLGNTDEDPLAD